MLIWADVTLAQVCDGSAVKAIRASSHAKFDRLVFEFYGDTVPPIESLAYAKPPFIGPSGEPEKVTGKFFVEAFWHTPMDMCSVNKKQFNLPILRSVKVYDLFEGDIRYIISLKKKAAFTTTKLASPGRLVLDFAK
ncbi:MAG TPA: hypothetical protein DIW24_07220 [Bacteroidetes bacterium]|nr:hypothetical protein [Bacteroidota bacterium]